MDILDIEISSIYKLEDLPLTVLLDELAFKAMDCGYMDSCRLGNFLIMDTQLNIRDEVLILSRIGSTVVFQIVSETDHEKIKDAYLAIHANQEPFQYVLYRKVLETIPDRAKNA